VVDVDWEYATRFGEFEFPRVTANVQLIDDPPALLQVVVEIADGAPAVVGIASHPRQPVLTGELLRRLPVANIARQTIALAAERRSGGQHSRRRPKQAKEFKQLARILRDGRGTRVTDETLRAVADVYRTAYASGASTRAAIEREFNVATSTAGRYISMARLRGFLPPTVERKARA
jgi:hypothetical protein